MPQPLRRVRVKKGMTTDDGQGARAFVDGFREARRDAGIGCLPPRRYGDPRVQRRFETGWRAGQMSWLRELRAASAAR
jgi:hypothetical protein